MVGSSVELGRDLSPFGYDLGTVEPSRDSMSRVFLSWLVLSDRDSMSLVVKDNI